MIVSMRMMTTVIDIMMLCLEAAIDNPTRYYGRTIGLGQQLVGLSYAEAGHYYHTRGLGGGNAMMAYYYYMVL